MTLSSAQVEGYARDGFVASVPALTREQAAQYREKLAAFERVIGGRLPAAAGGGGDRARPAGPLIGPDILVYTSTWFIKEPESAAIAAWHQDATYFGLRPYEHVTAWLALTDATAENGCMEFLPGSHRRGQLPHQAGVVKASVNRAGQAVTVDVDDKPGVNAPLHAGEFSLHHTRCLARSQM